MAIEAHGAVFSVGTGSGSPATITGVTLGAITEVTAVAHGFSAGDVVTFAAIVGTTELNGVTAMIIAKETDAMFFDIDSSGYTPYVSGGTATPVTWTEVGEFIDWDGPGGAAAVIDISHLQSTAKEKMLGLMDEGQFSITCNAVFANAGQTALQTARAARTSRNFKIVYSDAVVDSWTGYVMNMSSSGGVDDKVNLTVTIEISGVVTRT